VKKRTCSLICLKSKRGGFPYLRMSDIAIRCQVNPGLIERFVNFGLIDPFTKDQKTDEWLFESEVVTVVKKVLRFHNDLGINYAGIGVVMDLLSRIEDLEARICELESQRQ